MWRNGHDARYGARGRIQYRTSADVIFGRLTLSESKSAGAANGRRSQVRCSVLTEDAYRELFGLLDALGMPHLVRIWNYLPDINGETSGSERYWQFNSARQDAFIACGRAVTGPVPAACGVGSPRWAHRSLSIFSPAAAPPTVIENPRQVSAYHYPPAYSPRSPTFSRACLSNFAERPDAFYLRHGEHHRA